MTLGIGLALVGGEVLLRIAGTGSATFSRGVLHVQDSEAGWRGVPDCDTYYEQSGSFRVRVRCNSRGLRDDEHALGKVEGVRRIVCIGDSTTWGYGVENEEMFSSVLEQALPGTETINLGANGYSTVQELVRLETEGVLYHPDWTVLLFCWNDLEDNFDDKHGGRPVASFAQDGSVEITNRPVRKPWKSPLTQWLRHNSKLYVFLEYEIKSIVEEHASSQDEDAPILAAEEPLPDDPPVSATSLHASLVDIYRPPTPSIDRLWEAETRLLEKIRDLSQKNGTRLLVSYVPEKAAIHRPTLEELARLSRTALDALDPDRPCRRLGEICAALDVPYLDMTQIFRAHPDPVELYLIENMHWSARGHSLAAHAAAETIRALEQ
jgi:lysophospholipase L1-like esterase